MNPEAIPACVRCDILIRIERRIMHLFLKENAIGMGKISLHEFRLTGCMLSC